MKVNRAIILTILVILSMASCRTADTLTEDEILAFDKQEWFYSILLWDPYLSAGVANMTVEVTLGGEQMTLTSNATGSVEFTSVYHPEFEISVTGTGYFSSTRRINFFSEGDPERTKGLNTTFTVFPDADYGTYAFQGVAATVQSDLTTTATEPASGARFKIEIDFENFIMQFPVVTGTDGTYSVRVPANPNAGTTRFIYEAYEANQTIAVNALVDEPAFPTTLPSIMQIKTTFDPTNATLNSIPFVRPVFATVGATPAGVGAQVANLAVNGAINSAGVLTSVSIISGGSGYTPNSTTLPIIISSLQGGSGAVVTANTNGSGQVTSINLTNGGSGYPPFNANANKISGGEFFSADFGNNASFFPNATFRPGAIVINDIYYGTGSSRDKAVN